MPIPEIPAEESPPSLIFVGEPIEPTEAGAGVDWSRWLPRRALRGGHLEPTLVLQPVEGAE